MDCDCFTPANTGVLFQNTFTEPNGQTETETRTDNSDSPHKTLHNGSFEALPDGVTVTFTGDSVEHGPKNRHQQIVPWSRMASSTQLTKWISIRVLGK